MISQIPCGAVGLEQLVFVGTTLVMTTSLITPIHGDEKTAD